MPYKLGSRRLALDVAWEHNGVQYPANWLRLSTAQDRATLGIIWEDASPTYNQKWYWGKDSDGNLIPKTYTDLKTLWIAQTKQTANKLLQPSDWRVIKAKETSTNIPSTWKTYRAAVRTACNTRQGEIDACSDVAALKELLFGSAQIQQTDDDGNGVVDADGNPVMIANPNIATAWPDPVG